MMGSEWNSYGCMFLKRMLLKRRILFDTQLPAKDISADTPTTEYIPATPAVMVSESEYFVAFLKYPQEW